jgi:uncharacterized protein (TIGR02757 family)
MTTEEIKLLLDECVERYNRPVFIESDPIQIPRQFSLKQDIEIMGFWTAVLAWGQRKTIINKAGELARLMDNAPHEFILNHSEKDRERLLHFKHRTFQAIDTLYFLEFLQHFYRSHFSLEEAFTKNMQPDDPHVGNALSGFHRLFFSLPECPRRTRKHVPTPGNKSSCKRLNMFLRWMVRQDNNGIDFGIWKKIKPSQLLMPLDVHVEKVARRLGLLERKQPDWQAVLELTGRLKAMDENDPVKYDFALFGLGVLENEQGAFG